VLCCLTPEPRRERRQATGPFACPIPGPSPPSARSQVGRRCGYVCVARATLHARRLRRLRAVQQALTHVCAAWSSSGLARRDVGRCRIGGAGRGGRAHLHVLLRRMLSDSGRRSCWRFRVYGVRFRVRPCLGLVFRVSGAGFDSCTHARIPFLVRYAACTPTAAFIFDGLGLFVCMVVCVCVCCATPLRIPCHARKSCSHVRLPAINKKQNMDAWTKKKDFIVFISWREFFFYV